MEVPDEFVLLPFLPKKSQMLWTSTKFDFDKKLEYI